MPLLTGQTLVASISRTYHIYIPDNPPQATVPAIIVFHGGGQDALHLASHWGIGAGSPPPPLDGYLLIFPEADPRLSEEWVHFNKGDSAFPTYDLLFVDHLLTEITAAVYATGAAVPNVTVDPALIYAAGFSNGGGMVWQLMNSDHVSRFRGFAVVGKALDPEKAIHYRHERAALGDVPGPVPVIYVHGTGDYGFRSPMTLLEVPLDTTLPANTVEEMLTRNVVPPHTPSATTLVPGSTNRTEVVVQLFQGTEAFEYVTVVGGGHNWPTPTTGSNPPVAKHFDATQTIVEFWRSNAGLP
ncbi:MAG: alpha/beta hydrolase family esterase [Pseudonocardiaceae bacterium]